MGLIVDTCIFIAAERQEHSPNLAACQPYEHAYISVITVSELLIGVHRANTKARRLRRSAFAETILAEMPILHFTTEAARLHSELYAHLADKGFLIGAHDLIIAATALVHDYAILTTNKHEFKRVPGLKVLDYGV